MRIYSASSQETLRARTLLADWAGEGFFTSEQYQRLEKETVSELRTTNMFLRMVLFFFTLVSVGAASGLFFVVFLSRPSAQSTGVFSLIFAVACYAAAEVAVSRFRLYRYGIEEALAAFSVGFFCAGLEVILSSVGISPQVPLDALVLIAGAAFSLWIWRRFGLWYAFIAAMIAIFFVPGYWTSSLWAQHLLVAAFYATGLLCVVAARGAHRFDYLDDAYSLVEAFLWLGIYLALNLQLLSLTLLMRGLGGASISSQFPGGFYWATWVLIWCLPPVVLVRGIRRKDRSVIAAGVVAAILTFISNKPYLGWPRHSWDPMLLGILLTAIVLFVRRWLTGGPDGVRHDFTAARLSGKDQQWVDVGSAAVGLLTPQSITPHPQTKSADVQFGGGSSGGGGANGEF